MTDAEVLAAFELLARTEGIIPALESAHALAWVSRARERLARQGRAASTCRAGATRTWPRWLDLLGADLSGTEAG